MAAETPGEQATSLICLACLALLGRLLVALLGRRLQHAVRTPLVVRIPADGARVELHVEAPVADGSDALHGEATSSGVLGRVDRFDFNLAHAVDFIGHGRSSVVSQLIYKDAEKKAGWVEEEINRITP